MKMTRLTTPYLREQKFGVIVNFGSVGSWTGCPGMSHYAASKWAVSGFSESMTDELAPFGVKVICIEPGYFRTGFLNSGHVVWAPNRMQEEYKGTPAEEYRELAAQYNNNQPGDVKKAGPLIVDVLTKTGASKGRDIPMRLILGSDCSADVEKKAKSTLALMEEWKDISLATEYDN
jgi:short-subunit dehydrogenase